MTVLDEICPFCGNGYPLVRYDTVVGPYYVQCYNCLKKTRRQLNKESAIRDWENKEVI